MSAAGTLYSVRFPYQLILVAGRDNRDVLEVERNGQRVVPTSVDYTLYDPGQTEVYTSSPTPGRTTPVTVSAASLPTTTVSYGTGWLARWVVTMPDGQEYTWDREAIVARRALFPVCGESDLLEEYPGLRTHLGAQADVTSLQTWLDAGWKTVLAELSLRGKYGDTTCSADAFRTVHKHHALAGFFRWLHFKQPDEPAWNDLYHEYEVKADSAWGRVNFRQDMNRDGFPDSDQRKGASAVLHMNAARSVRTRRTGRW